MNIATGKWSPILLLLALTINVEARNECVSRDYGNGGTVCVCNSTYCDYVPVLAELNSGEFVVFTSNKAGLRFQERNGRISKKYKSADNEINISNDEYQPILGWGGAFTDATGINVNSLDEGGRNNLLRAYFSDEGIEYNQCRVPIGGTDFSTHAYSYLDTTEEDQDLINFKLAQEDFDYKIPLIKKALTLTNNLQFFASAWTAPKWMKINNAYSGMFGFLKGEMYQPWANYYLKFLQFYEKEGIHFWGITTGNEPSLALTPSSINSVAWLPYQMRNWIKNNLGPTLRNSNYSDIKIMAIDDQRFFLPWYVDSVFSNEDAKKYVDGIAVHWYYDSTFSASLLTTTHDKYPDKFILLTEACKGDKLYDSGVKLGSWQRGEDYASNIIENVNHWASGWTDWNMALDLTGGPTYINNNVDSPIIVNKTSGEFYKQPMYYALGHFAKYVPRNSVRIGTASPSDNLSVVAFRRPDNKTVVVILNKSNAAVPVSVVDDNKGTIQLDLTANSFTTVVYF